MNGRRVRLAVLAPLAMSSLALGAVTFTAPTAAAASPACGVRSTDDPKNIQVSGMDFKPNKNVAVESASGAEGTVKADANGNFSLTVTNATGTVSAQQVGGPEVKCGTAAEGEQKDAREQFRQGFKDGFNDVKQDCKQNRKQGITKVDPNYEAGYKAGAEVATNRFC